MDKAIERRFVHLEGFEFRVGDGKAPELHGYASVFNQATNIMGLWLEEVAPGAYSKTVAENDIRALWNHDTNIVLGRNKADTLKLSEDAKGLHSIILPPDNEWGRPVLDAVKRGDVTGMSIAFRAVKQEWFRPDPDSNELPKRTIREAKLYEVSPVTFPAFEQTSIAARSQDGAAGEEEDIIERARRLVRCAERGYPLTTEDRTAIAVAFEILRSHVPTSEPGAQEANHSEAARTNEPEAGSVHHSAAYRARTLELLAVTIR